MQFRDSIIDSNNEKIGDVELAKQLIIENIFSNKQIAELSGINLSNVSKLRIKIRRGRY